MPELPEVETFRRRFLHGTEDTPSLLGKRVVVASILWDRTVAEPTPEEFIQRVAGKTIHDIGRRGKFLLFMMNELVLVVHLRMSGDLLVEPVGSPIARHHRVILDLNDGNRLAFNDTRKFGRVWLTKDINGLLAHLGPEPLDETFTAEMFFDLLQKRKRRIKPLLLDQHFLAGLGNIYTDEALFHAGFHPNTIANTLNLHDAAKLLSGIRLVLSEAIERSGSSIDWIYRGGEFQNYFKVYQRTNEPCYKCNQHIQRIIVGQRGTHYCPTCQPLKSIE